MPINLANYPSDWKLRSRFVRFSRAKNHCEWCGAENHQPHPETGSRVVLTTAHIHDKNPMAARLMNLAALCQRCHLRHDAKDHANARYRKRGNGLDPLEAKTLVECVRICAWQNTLPMSEIAKRMQYSPSDLSRKLAQSPDDSRRFTLDDLEKFMQITKDVRPLKYLAEKYLASDLVRRLAELELENARLKGKKR